VGSVFFGGVKHVWIEKRSSFVLGLEVRLLGAIFTSRNIIRKIESFFTSKKNYFSKRYIISLASAAFVVLVIKFYPVPPDIHSYYLSLAKDDIGQTTKNLYLAEDKKSTKFGQVGADEKGRFVELASSPISLVWKPSRFPLNKEVSVSAEFEDSGDWDISMVCSRCKPSKKYNWQPFYRGALRDHELVQSFGGVHVYAKEKPTEQTAASSLKEYLSKVVQPGASIRVLDNSYPLSEIATAPDDFVEGSRTTIETGLQGSHELFLYLADALSAEVTVVRNGEFREAASAIMLSDIDGNKISQEAFREATAATVTPSQRYVARLNQKLPSAGVYRLLVDIQSDETIVSLSVNTNKVVVSSGVSLSAPSDLYTEVLAPTVFSTSLNVRTSNAVTSFAAGEGVQAFDLDFRRDAVTKTIQAGSYAIKSTGSQKIVGSFFAFNRDQYFSPTLYNISKTDSPDIIIALVKMEKSRSGYLAELAISREELLRVGGLKKVTFEIRNAALGHRFSQESVLKMDNYSKIITHSNYDLWAKDNVLEVEASNSLEGLLANMLPRDTVLSMKGAASGYHDLITSSAVSSFSSAPNIIENISLRGSHQFYIYLEKELDLTLIKEDMNWYEGRDDVAFKLQDIKGNTICESVVADDGNVSKDATRSHREGLLGCANVSDGVYILSVQEIVEGSRPRNDFSITKMTVNTNRLVTKDVILPIEPISLFSDSLLPTALDLFYWHEGRDQKIIVNGGEEILELTKEDNSKNKHFTLGAGTRNVVVPVGDLYIHGGNFAFSPDQYFDFHSSAEQIKAPKNVWQAKLARTESADYQVLPSVYSGKSYLRNFYVDTQ
jgi:hypothetical protein